MFYIRSCNLGETVNALESSIYFTNFSITLMLPRSHQLYSNKKRALCMALVCEYPLLSIPYDLFQFFHETVYISKLPVYRSKAYIGDFI